MTQQPQQLKFGDRVRQKSDGATGVVVHQQFQSVWVVFEGSTTSDVDYADEFELIPHLDTVRLDWLADLSNPANPIARVVPIEIYLGKRLNGLRDAIDAAMQIQAAEDA